MPELTHGLHLAFYLLGGFTGLSALIFYELKSEDGDSMSQHGTSSALETWAAHKSLNASIAREAPAGPNPQPLSDGNLLAGIKAYESNCMVCHGAADGKASNIALGLYQEAPQLAKDGVEDDPDGKIYWKIKHGIRLTGMPSFGKTLQDADVWRLTLFLKHMDSLPPKVRIIWEQARQ